MTAVDYTVLVGIGEIDLELDLGYGMSIDNTSRFLRRCRGGFAVIGPVVQARLAADKGRADPDERQRRHRRLAELGFPPPLCRGLFVLSRSVGALAHAFEELLSGERNKGPIPRQLIWTYTGPPACKLPRDRAGGST